MRIHYSNYLHCVMYCVFYYYYSFFFYIFILCIFRLFLLLFNVIIISPIKILWCLSKTN